jgi:hypothetical protein
MPIRLTPGFKGLKELAEHKVVRGRSCIELEKHLSEKNAALGATVLTDRQHATKWEVEPNLHEYVA